MRKQRIISAGVAVFFLLNGPFLLTESWLPASENAEWVPEPAYQMQAKPAPVAEARVASEYDVYQERMATIQSEIPLKFDRGVSWHFRSYLKDRHSAGLLVSKAQHYFPAFQNILAMEGVPSELANLAFIESNLNPKAKSPMGAGGFWQFMPATARRLGLKMDNFVDERSDPTLSTRAAAKYLKELNNEFDNWIFAIAAYNCGPGNVNKAIRRSGGKTDYESIRLHLPKQTRAYVAKFMAATYLTSYYHLHNVKWKASVSYPKHGFNHEVVDSYDFKELADLHGVTVKAIQFLNPSYKHTSFRNIKESITIRIPAKPPMKDATEELLLGRNN